MDIDGRCPCQGRSLPNPPPANREAVGRQLAPANGTRGGVPTAGPRLRPKVPPAEEEPLSWWAARATAAEVTAGFTREAILAEVPPDPAAEGGLFDRLGQILGQLSQALIAS